MAKGKLLIICGCANYIFMLFLLLLQFHKMNVYIILLSTNRVKNSLWPNCPFYGLNLPTVAGIILYCSSTSFMLSARFFDIYNYVSSCDT